MSLSGVDSLYWFEIYESQWLQPNSANGYLPSLGKFRAETPALMGQFPATALLFRKGYVSQGEPVVVEHRTYSSMLALEKPLIAEFKPYDPNVDEKYDVAMAEGLRQWCSRRNSVWRWRRGRTDCGMDKRVELCWNRVRLGRCCWRNQRHNSGRERYRLLADVSTDCDRDLREVVSRRGRKNLETIDMTTK